jgi:hypothetical protein
MFLRESSCSANDKACPERAGTQIPRIRVEYVPVHAVSPGAALCDRVLAAVTQEGSCSDSVFRSS